MKHIVNKISDCFFTIAAGAVLVALFENKANSIYISLIAFLFAILIAIGASYLPDKKGE